MQNSISAAGKWKPSSRAFRPASYRSTRSEKSTHANQALLRMFHPGGYAEGHHILRGAALDDVFPAEVLQDLEPLLRRADRMGMTTSQMQMPLLRASLNVAVTVATLRHEGADSGYVMVFEDLSDF